MPLRSPESPYGRATWYNTHGKGLPRIHGTHVHPLGGKLVDIHWLSSGWWGTLATLATLSRSSTSSRGPDGGGSHLSSGPLPRCVQSTCPKPTARNGWVHHFVSQSAYSRRSTRAAVLPRQRPGALHSPAHTRRSTYADRVSSLLDIAPSRFNGSEDFRVGSIASQLLPQEVELQLGCLLNEVDVMQTLGSDHGGSGGHRDRANLPRYTILLIHRERSCGGAGGVAGART